MRKSQIKIFQIENKIVIKKKLSVLSIVIHILVIIACLAVPFFHTDSWNDPLFWVFYLLGCTFINFASSISDFLGKIVLHIDTKEICIYNLCKEKYNFDEIKEIKSVCDTTDPEGNFDDCKLVIIMNDGHKAELYTNSQQQNEELKEYIGKQVLLHKQSETKN
jgi:hypothetical protein